MHMPKSAATSILNNELSQEAIELWNRLNPQRWPFQTEELPAGTVLVGGAVRDALLNRVSPPLDIDLIVPCNALKVSEDLAKKLGGKVVVLDKKREIARLVINKWTIDIANQEGNHLEDDLFRRDFRINSIALSFERVPRIIDPTGGLKDIKTKTLVAVKEQNLRSDPLRLIRAFRLMAEMLLTLEPQTKKWINTHKKLLSTVAPERIQSEILKIIFAPWAEEAIKKLKKTELLAKWQNPAAAFRTSPSFTSNAELFNDSEKSIAVPLARLTDLLSDKGLSELRFSKKYQQRCHALRYWQRKSADIGFENLDEANRLKLHKDLEDDLPALILQLKSSEQAIWLDNWRDPNHPLFHPASPLDGHTLQQCLNLSSSKELGQLIHHLCHERAFGRVTSKEDALFTARSWWKQNSPNCD